MSPVQLCVLSGKAFRKVCLNSLMAEKEGTDPQCSKVSLVLTSRYCSVTAVWPYGQCSSPFTYTWPWAGSELQTQLSYVGSMPLSSRHLGRYQIILLGVLVTTCPKSLPIQLLVSPV